MIRYILDTDISIYLLKGIAPKAANKIGRLTPGDVGITTVTIAELLFGAEKSDHIEKNKSAIDRFISPLVILPFDTSAAARYGKIRKLLESKGTPIGSMDLMIAAIASSFDAILVTNNVKEFRRVPGLKVENWA
jgi:tRNA(fMet)-specific endonuclease VapC